MKNKKKKYKKKSRRQIALKRRQKKLKKKLKSRNNNIFVQKKIESVSNKEQKYADDYELKRGSIVEQKKTTKHTISTAKIIAISIFFLILITIIYILNLPPKEEDNNKDIVYYFSSNLNNYTVNINNLDDENDEHNKEWVNIGKDTIINATENNYQLTLKNIDDNSVINIDQNTPYFKTFNQEYIAMPLGKKIDINYIFYYPYEDITLSFISSNDCVTINQNTITASKDGSAIIYATFNDQLIEIMKVDSSSLIVERPSEFDNSKSFVKCEQYTNEENNTLDSILENKINYVGYKTRAGAVEAMRFLAFDFPYRIDYFNENGRLPHVDGEGRYYHKGLYLSTGKYKNLVDPERKNKGTWGCKIYSNPLEAYKNNGVDCSGLITWALFNDGFDPGDTKGANLLMTLGEKCSIKKAIENDKIKVGDFVHNNEADSHIGMIIGIDETYYYVIQSIWYSPYGVCVTKYTKDKMIKHWIEAILLDDYYINDGLLTNMWY